MHLFKNELLRETPRPVVRSYARPTYGPRYARRAPPPASVSAVVENITVMQRAAPPAWPSFDRAA
ncbi:MAG: hypothetical protein HOQ02_04295 [Lysobacter sp.]|nr:hypothetical protein [Lysobacter sp.]